MYLGQPLPLCGADLEAGVVHAQGMQHVLLHFEVGAIVRAAQRRLADSRAILKRPRGFEQRADLDTALDIEQPCQP
jgi:hypothetical protein